MTMLSKLLEVPNLCSKKKLNGPQGSKIQGTQPMISREKNVIFQSPRSKSYVPGTTWCR